MGEVNSSLAEAIEKRGRICKIAHCLMPIYEYRCEGCAKEIEVVQKFSDPPLDKCPDCGGELTKLISRSSFHLKGSGWYVTDYKKGTSASTGSKEAAPAKTPEASSPAKETSTVSKGEKKKDS